LTPLPDDGREERVLILAPRGKDAHLAQAALTAAGLSSHACSNLQALITELRAGAGAILVAEEAIPSHQISQLTASLEDEPSWSELPIVVLLAVAARDARVQSLRHLERLRNMTLLDRPVRIANLVSTLQSALRARRRQYEIRDLMRELQRALQTRDELIASVSHELRTPLNVILGWAASLQRRAADPTQTKEAIAILERNARMLWQLVEDLIDVSRIASGRVQLKMQPVDLGATVRAAVDTLQPSATARRVELTSVVDPDLPCVRGDDVRLQQVVWNLTWNALKFTPPDGRVDVSLQETRAGVELVIADTGIGIDPGFLPHVFEPFRQGTPSNSDPSRGLGLGLAIVRHLIELHGGTIDAHSEGVGRGARFRVVLPAAAPEVSSRPDHPEAQAIVALRTA
jgi:signal transduction histidine kinase